MEIAWTVVAVLVPALWGFAGVFVSITPAEFRAAKWCFWLSAIILGGMDVFWQINTDKPLVFRIVVGIALWSLIGVGLPEVIRWVNGREHHVVTNNLPATGPYLWLTSNVWFPDSAGNIDAVRIHLQVRDYPETEHARKGLMSLSSLENVHAIVSVPIFVDPYADGWHSCIVADVRSPQWNNDNGAYQPLGIIGLNGPVTVLEFRITTKNGQWGGASILRKIGKAVSHQTSLIGHFADPKTGGSAPTTTIFEESLDGLHKTGDYATEIRITKSLLVSLGLPALRLSPAEKAVMCSKLKRSFQ